ncbi:hypothetical protein J2S17_004173 [Cytobacillus purgationiresistens]|uniref:DUF1540 domain-containing protein n=2 Tax=Cytobacillus purgationiresistens TaxID=863449 RepID=A0ABU0ALY3_9BACI|nr:hypothetical protein [Cytobacillus purgationiresistens]
MLLHMPFMSCGCLEKLKKVTFTTIQKDVRVMAKDVLCEVNNCTFWESGNRCNATQIYVVSHKGDTAKTSKETDCQTFERQ